MDLLRGRRRAGSRPQHWHDDRRARRILSRPARRRLGPGDNFGVSAMLPEGIVGEIVAHTAQTDGVLARGAHWWKVAFSETSGWVNEDSLRPVADRPRLP